jgi:hypothetical protein
VLLLLGWWECLGGLFGGGKLSKESCRLKVGGDLEGPQKDPEGNFL